MATGIYLELEVGVAAIKQLTAVLGICPVACLLLRTNIGECLDQTAAAELVRFAQGRDIAVLISADTTLARKLGADGLHLDWSPDIIDHYVLARETLSSDAIVGADTGNSRHDAMVLGEAGADYIGFRPAEVRADADDSVARKARVELVAWWAEVAEVPCVAFDVTSLEEASGLLNAGADFLGFSFARDATPGQIADIVGALAQPSVTANASRSRS